MQAQQMITELLVRLDKENSFRLYLAEMQEILDKGQDLSDAQMNDLREAWEHPERDRWDAEDAYW